MPGLIKVFCLTGPIRVGLSRPVLSGFYNRLSRVIFNPRTFVSAIDDPDNVGNPSEATENVWQNPAVEKQQ